MFYLIFSEKKLVVLKQRLIFKQVCNFFSSFFCVILLNMQATISDMLRQDKIRAWRLAVDRCRRWTKIKTEEQKRERYKRLSTLPIGLFLLLSFGTLILSQHAKALKF